MKQPLSTRATLAALSLATLLAACGTPPSPVPGPPQRVPGSHTARDALDWEGVYEGTLPCADCPGLRTRLTLLRTGTYLLQTQYLDRQPTPDTVRGNFTWQPDGTRITLDERGSRQQYFVAEGRLIQLYRDGTRPGGPLAPNYILKKTGDAPR